MNLSRTLSCCILILVALGCGDGDSPHTTLEPQVYPPAVAFVGGEHEQPRAVPITVAPHATKESRGDAWVMDQLDSLKEELDDGTINQDQYDALVKKVLRQAEEAKNHALNKGFTIYGGIADPNGGRLHGWQINVVYGISMAPDDLHISINGDWEIQQFSSTQRDDGCWDVTFFIATKAHEGIINWRGLLEAIVLRGNM